MNIQRPVLAFFLLAGPVLLWSAGGPRSRNPADLLVEYAVFKEPPGEYRGHRWFTYNLSTISDASVIEGIQQAIRSDSYGSFMITPSGGATTGLSEAYLKGSRRPPSDKGVAYLSDEYFRLYRRAGRAVNSGTEAPNSRVFQNKKN